jgi:hypothetical protein
MNESETVILGVLFVFVLFFVLLIYLLIIIQNHPSSLLSIRQ